jgi:hypothetical protein
MAMLEAMASGKTDPEKLASYTTGKLKASHEQLVQALDGRYSDHFRWLLRQLLDEYRHLTDKVGMLEAELGRHLRPYHDVIRRLCTIPGVDIVTACAMVAELGADMSVFADSAHVASWAGLCPGNNESAGKRLSGRTRKGNRYLRRLLVQNAWAVSHQKDCYLSTVFHRVAGRRGVKKAAVAVAHKILVIAYYIIRDSVKYRDPGGDFFDRRDPKKTAKQLTKRLERLGFSVTLNRSAAANRHTKARSGRIRPPISLEQASGCSRCARWGIPCIHARNSATLPTTDLSASD